MLIHFKVYAEPVFVSDKDINSEMDTPTGILFNPTGSKMYVVGFVQNFMISYIAQYDPFNGTPFSISSASLDENKDILSVLKRPQDIKFNSDGTKVFGNFNQISNW